MAARFFSPPDSSNGRPVREVGDLHLRQRLVAGLDLVRGQAELERPERHVIQDGGAEELDVGILEDEADLAMEPERVLAGRDRGDVPAQRAHPRRRADDPVEELEERGLAAAVRPEQADLLAAVDVQVDPVEGDMLVRVDVADAAQVEDGLDGRRRRGRRGVRRRRSVTAANDPRKEDDDDRQVAARQASRGRSSGKVV